LKQRLSGKYLTLLIALQEGPMDLLKDLAKRVGNSPTTVSKDLKWLSGEHPSQKTRFFRVVPDLNEGALGLVTVDVFLEIRNLSNIRIIEKFCDDHPYTKYRARCFGYHSGLFVQFRVPKGTESFLKSLFSGLKKQDIVVDYTVLSTTGVEPIFSTSLLKHWNSSSFTWDFDWNGWSKKKVKSTPDSDKLIDSVVHILTSREISILTQLSYGARRKQIEIIRALEKDSVSYTSQDFSRSLALLNDQFIKNYMIFLDPEAFNLYSNVLLTAKCTNTFVDDLASRLKTHPIPFRSTLRVNGDEFLWFLRLPPNHLSSVFTYLLANVEELDTSLLDYQTSVAYGVWSGAFNDNQRGWIESRKFIVDDPLSSINDK